MEQIGYDVEIRAQIDKFNKTMQQAGRIVETTASGMDKSTKRAAQSFASIEAKSVPFGKALRAIEGDMAKVQRAMDKGAVSAERAAPVVRNLADRYEMFAAKSKAAQVAAVGIGGAVSGAGGRFTRMGPQVQNAAFQIGDFAVQVAAGTSATRALSMQLPQLLGGFGVFGAVAGGAVAIMGALAPALLDAEDASTALEDAQDALAGTIRESAGDAEELRRKYAGLTDEMRALETTSLTIALRKQQDAIAANLDEGQEAMRAALLDAIPPGTRQVWQDVLADIDNVNSAMDAFTQFNERAGRQSSNPEVFAAVAEAAVAAAQKERGFTEETERLRAALDALGGDLNAATRAFEDNGDAAERAKKALDEEAKNMAEVRKEVERLAAVRDDTIASMGRDCCEFPAEATDDPALAGMIKEATR